MPFDRFLKMDNLPQMCSEEDMTFKECLGRCYAPDFEDRAGQLGTKKCVWTLEIKIGKNTNSSPKSP